MAANSEFLNRKLHSFLGVFPVGLFLIQHFAINYFATRGASAFNQAADFMANLPFRYALEIFVIFLPMIYHAFYGIYMAFQSNSNLRNYSFFRNWLFVLQRITGIFLFIFISWHVWETRIAAAFGKEVNYDMMAEIFSNPLMVIFYIAGILSATFHLSNGIWSFLISWGITTSPKSQKVATYFTMMLFFTLTFVGIRFTFAFLDPVLGDM
ncbi:succinate dehydrogenase cytochrome b558 subunit [Planococcus dechangensis]|uniref:Succinate dehydrogenase cytochrome b558 subunit n=1 Tax=Planococcus dechangensis TaxID=1176255 RepID=A0ABV9M8R0_9BACL